MTDDYLGSLKKTSDGNYIVTMKYPDSLPALRKAKKEETRQKIEFVFDNRCAKENLPLLQEIIKLRQGNSFTV
jgi:thimet oligopeptidase